MSIGGKEGAKAGKVWGGIEVGWGGRKVVWRNTRWEVITAHNNNGVAQAEPHIHAAGTENYICQRENEMKFFFLK